MTNLLPIDGIKYVVREAKGKVYTYAYHRATGKPVKPRPIGGLAFLTRVAELDAEAKASADLPPPAGSLGELITAYRESSDFTQLADRTKSDYQDVFDFLHKIRDMDASLIDAPFVLALRDKAFKLHKRRFANYVVSVLSLLFTWALPRWRGLTINPGKGTPKIRKPRGARIVNRAWKDWEKPIVLAALPIHVRWPIALAMHAGLREGDLCAAPRSTWSQNAVDLEAQRKTGNPHWVPASKELLQVRADYQAWLATKKLAPLFLCVNSRGQKWTENGLRASFFKIIRALREASKVNDGLTIHGLRHTRGRDVVDAGGDSRDAAAAIGDVTSAMGDHYSREADRRSRAKQGVRKLERSAMTKAGRRRTPE